MVLGGVDDISIQSAMKQKLSKDKIQERINLLWAYFGKNKIEQGGVLSQLQQVGTIVHELNLRSEGDIKELMLQIVREDLHKIRIYITSFEKTKNIEFLEGISKLIVDSLKNKILAIENLIGKEDRFTLNTLEHGAFENIIKMLTSAICICGQ
jgi:hypothetical protein